MNLVESAAESLGGLCDMVDGYVECALWSSTCDEMESLAGEELAPEPMAAMMQHCMDFVDYLTESGQLDDLTAYAVARSWTDAGHDFWLTRNGHGAGFWDRGLGDLGDRLTEASKTFGGVDLYLGDDGLVYVS